jgi:Flp pilus assembly protein, ATPase CpaF
MNYLNKNMNDEKDQSNLSENNSYGDRVSDYVTKKIIQTVDLNEMMGMPSGRKFECINAAVKKITEEDRLIINDKRISDIVRKIYEDAFEFGPVSCLMKDDRITEIMVNNWDEVFVEFEGTLKKTGILFRDQQHVRNVFEKIISSIGLRIDESCPMVDARLKDGSRLNMVISPASVKPIVVTIRKFKKNLLDMDDLVKAGTLTGEISEFLKECVKRRFNIIISGATSTGKTTFLNVLSNFIPTGERIITIEETQELNLSADNLVSLEGRPSNIEGRGEITLRGLVKNSLRMRPDRIMVGEIRGNEAIDVLSAMNTGHEGSMTTLHANSPFDLVSRLETLLLISALNLSPVSARRIIASAIDLIIHLEKKANGCRTLAKICSLSAPKNRLGSNIMLEVKDIFSRAGMENNYDFIPEGKIADFLNKKR